MANETSNLISSEKVEGTAVYGPDSEKVGSIESVMIDKVSGKVAYAVLSFGGFLGMGDEHYPLPWHWYARPSNPFPAYALKYFARFAAEA
jgi:sporulation protein YlmC with PRC-barrel domain